MRKEMSLNQLCECGMRKEMFTGNGLGGRLFNAREIHVKRCIHVFFSVFPKFDRRASTQMPWEIKTVSLNHINV